VSDLAEAGEAFPAGSRRWRARRIDATGTDSEIPFLGAPRLLVVVAVLTIIALVYANGAGAYTQSVVALGAGYLVACLGYNLTLGYAGQFAFGQAGFLAIGAYVYAVLQEHGMALLPAVVLAAAAAAAAGALIGLAVLRTSGFYLALVTLGFAQAIVVGIELLHSQTHGNNGIAVDFFGTETVFVSIFIALAALLFVDRVVHSRTGRALLMIGQDESAARAVGVPVGLSRVVAFSLGGLLGGLGGVIVAGSLGFVTPENFSIQLTLLLLTMVVVGGLGSLLGTVVGVAVFTALPEFSSAFVGWQEVAYGGILLAVIYVLPGGLVSLPDAVSSLRDRFAKARS
jgi:branched-chain amino acid transport system permease protein